MNIERSTQLRKIIRESVVVKNPALVEVVGLFPVIAAAVSLKASIIICSITTVLIVITGLIASALLKKVPRFVRVLIYTLINSGLVFALSLLFTDLAPNETTKLGIVLPLLAVNSFTALHCERFSVKQTVPDAFLSCLGSAFGYCIVVLTVGTFREALGSGTLYGYELDFISPASGILLPFGGFIALGFLAAALKAIRLRLYPHYSEESVSDVLLTEPQPPRDGSAEHDAAPGDGREEMR